MNKEQLTKITGSEKLAKGIMGKSFIKADWKKPFEKWQNTFVGAFLTKNPKQNHIIDLMCDALKKETITWGDLTKVNLIRISEYINGEVAPNTASVYLHILHALLQNFSEEGVLPIKSMTGTMKTKTVPSQHVALTQEEVDRFDAYVPQTIAERDIKTLFMRACYTGARCSDAKAMSEGSIVKALNGDILTYVSQKTKIEVALPLHHNLQKYLDCHLTKDYSAKTTSEVVRRICKSIGMTERVSLFVGGKLRTGEKWEFITMHSARRTFCTLLAQRGVNVETIRAMAGHTTSTMTDRYICLDGRNPGADAMGFFMGNNTGNFKTA